MFDSKKIFGAFVIGLALFFFWPAVVGSWQEIGALKDAIAQRQDLLKQRQDAFDHVKSLYAEYKSKLNAQDSQKFSSLVPVKKDSAELVSAIQAIGNDSGMTIKEVRIADVKSTDTQFQTLNISLDLTGGYPALRAFLGELEQYVRLLNVRALAVTSDTGQSGGALNFTLRAEAYFLK